MISNGKSSRCNLSSDVRQAVTKEERTARRAARKERANAYLSSIGSGAAAESAATTGKAADVSSSSGGLGFDASRLGWYAAVLVPTAFIGWGVYDENSPPAQFSRFIGLTDKFDEFAKPTRTKLLPDWNQVSLITVALFGAHMLMFCVVCQVYRRHTEPYRSIFLDISCY